ncbi:SapC family protein [Caulobacter soli]|uniref:SapC family protein n=1 Tax=Caulobacter soli TaxID=2708539 RepID=UPI0013EDA2A9|nr:SapC family protein [Caulobacter soli]
MPNIAVLNSQTHRDLAVRTEAAARLGDGERFVPVVVTEFSHLAAHYPILLSKDANTGGFYFGAMLGFDPGENLFLDESKGHDAYRPLNLRRGPFYTAGSDLAVDLDHPRLAGAGGLRVFSEEGQPTAYLESVFAIMRDLRPGEEMTKVFIQTLLALKLIEPIDIDVGFDDGTTRQLQGLYTLNQDALRELPDDKVVELFRRGYLQLIYLVIGSLKQIPVLARRKNLRLLDGSEALAGAL